MPDLGTTMEQGSHTRQGRRVESVTVVAAFDIDQAAPLKLGTVLASLAEQERSQVVPVSVPTIAPANVPRFIMGMDQQVISVGLDRVQITITPPDHVCGSLDESFEFVERTVDRLLRPLVTFEWMHNQWVGCIVEFCNPVDTDSLSGASAIAASLMTNVGWTGDDLVSFDLQIGKRVGDFYRTFRLSTYEKRQAKVVTTPGEFMQLADLGDQSSVVEIGLAVTVDVNNRPSKLRKSNAEELQTVVAEAKTEISSMLTMMPA